MEHRTKPNIEIVTNKGNKVTLKWDKSEYRAFNNFNQDLKLGAVVPEALIEYIKERL